MCGHVVGCVWARERGRQALVAAFSKVPPLPYVATSPPPTHTHAPSTPRPSRACDPYAVVCTIVLQVIDAITRGLIKGCVKLSEDGSVDVAAILTRDLVAAVGLSESLGRQSEVRCLSFAVLPGGGAQQAGSCMVSPHICCYCVPVSMCVTASVLPLLPLPPPPRPSGC